VSVFPLPRYDVGMTPGIRLYVYALESGWKRVVGGGTTTDGNCADIYAELPPDGAFGGVAARDWAPGVYEQDPRTGRFERVQE